MVPACAARQPLNTEKYLVNTSLVSMFQKLNIYQGIIGWRKMLKLKHDPEKGNDSHWTIQKRESN